MSLTSVNNRLIFNFSIATALVFLSFGLIYFLKGSLLLGGFEFFLGIAQLGNIIYLRRTQNDKLSGRILVLSVYLMSMIIFILGGIGNTGFLWIQFIPLFTVLILDYRESSIWALGYTLVLLAVCGLHLGSILYLKYSGAQIIQGLLVYHLFVYLTYNNEKLKHMAREELTWLSQTDALTKLYNRGYLNDVLDDEMYRFKRYGTPFSLIMLDIDHFKMINDRFGHQKGDEVLIAIAEILLTQSRQSDTAARWGGEEFLVVCPNTGLADAGKLAEKLRAAIEDLHLEETMNLSASFGVAEIQESQNVSSLLTEADSLLYNAKHQGRNCVVLMDSLRN